MNNGFQFSSLPCRRIALGLLALSLLLLLLRSDLLWAGELQESNAVRAGAEGLRQAARFPWYDAEGDQLRPLRVPVYQSPLRSSDWEWQTTNRRRTSVPWLWQLLEYAVWGFLALILFLLLFWLTRSVTQRYLQQHFDEADERTRRKTEADRIENLPFHVKRPQTDLLGEARRQYQQGNYGEAIIYLFSYQLVQLDRNHFILLAKGKTNRQYLGELRPTTALGRMLMQSMSAFEDVFFGHYTLSRERFERCWVRLEEFHQLVQQSTETA